MAKEKGLYPWNRFWLKIEDEPTNPENSRFNIADEGVPLSGLFHVPCLILLGSVGMGKSTVIENEYKRLRAICSPQHGVAWLNMRTLSETEIVRRVFADDDVKRWVSGEAALTLFLDSLDECWRRVDSVEQSLAAELQNRITEKSKPLFLRISCRSAEWREDSRETFDRLFAKRREVNPPVQTFILAPLTNDHIRAAAAIEGINGDGLLQRIGEKNAGPLVSHPITAKMLIGEFKKHGDFPKTRTELYYNAVLALCEDRNVGKAGQYTRKTTPNSRVAVARRIAAVSVLTNRYVINTNVECGASDSHILNVTDIFGFDKEAAAGEKTDVNKETVAETLESGLFGENNSGLQIWSHQSFAEYLAASYLVEKKLGPKRIIPLLTDTSDNRGKIVPQLEETACWVAEISPEVFGSLVQSNPDVLFRCDASTRSENDRASLVSALLDGVRKHEASVQAIQFDKRMARLRHAKLGEQLRSVIRCKSENVLVRQLAIDIADCAEVTEVFDDIVERFLDTSEHIRVRKHAGTVLKSLPNRFLDDLKVRGLAMDWSHDEDDDLKGYLLEGLWPAHISLKEVLTMLTPPKQPNLFGSYQHFFGYLLPNGITNADLSNVLCWLREQKIRFDILHGFGYLPSKTFARSLSALKIPEVRAEVIAALKSNTVRLKDLFSGLPESGLPLDDRLELARCIIDSDFQNLRQVAFVSNPRILLSTDIAALSDDYRSCNHEPTRGRWRTLFFSIFMHGQEREALEALCDLARGDEEINTELIQRTSCRLNDPNLMWLKEEEERGRELKRLKDAEPKFEDRLKACLDQFDRGNAMAYCSAIELLDTDPDNVRNIFDYSAQLSANKAWGRTPVELRTRVLQAGPRFLKEQPAEGLIRDDKIRYPFDIVNPLFVLMFDEDKAALDSLSPEIWQKWIPTLVWCNPRRNGKHRLANRYIFSLALRVEPKAFNDAICEFLRGYVNDDTKRQIVWDLDEAWSPEIRDVCRSLLENPELKPTAALDLFQILVEKEPVETELLLKEKFASNNEPFKATAATVLLRNFPTIWASKIIEVIQRESQFGVNVVHQLINSHHGRTDWLSAMVPELLLSFWEWLEMNFPKNPYDEGLKSRSAQTYTSEHDIYHFKNGVLQTIRQLGTPESCAAMANLVKKRPTEFWLGEILAEMRKATHRKRWVCSAPAKLMAAFAQHRKVINTAGDLASVLLDSMERYQERLKRKTPSLELWNEETRSDHKKYFKPKDENNVSNCLANYFREDLTKFSIVAEREVQMRPNLTDPAQLCDIDVVAIPFDEDGRPNGRVEVVVEVKCAWNPGVLTDMEDQLFGRYMKNENIDFGIYVVAHFGSSWNWGADSRMAASGSKTALQALGTTLQAQADKLSTGDKKVSVFVLDARLEQD